MLKLGRGAQFKMLFLVLVFVFNFDLFKFSAAILEKGLLMKKTVCKKVTEPPGWALACTQAVGWSKKNRNS